MKSPFTSALLGFSILLICFNIGCDKDSGDDTPSCIQEECEENCVLAGHESGYCDGNSCMCIEKDAAEDPETDSQEDPIPDPTSDPEIDYVADTPPDTIVDSEMDPELDPDIDLGLDPDLDPDADPDIDVEPDSPEDVEEEEEVSCIPDECESACIDDGYFGGHCEGTTCVCDDPPTLEWTVLVYMMADNDLEGYAAQDLEEMMEYGSSDDANIIAQIDRHTAYISSEIGGITDWTGTKRVYVQDGSLDEISDLGEIDSADPDTLIDFISWGVLTYPAERYSLILWNHGGGWIMFGYDDHDGSQFNLSELDFALGQGLSESGLDKFDLLGFDACLMATLEVAFQLEEEANRIVASEEMEPGFGWHYAPIAEALNSTPTIDADGLASVILSSYLTFSRTYGIETFTLSNIDPTASLTLSAYMNQLGLAFAGNEWLRDDWIPIAWSRYWTQEYGRSSHPLAAVNVIDIGDFLDLIEYSTDDEYSTIISSANTWLESTVVESVHGDLAPWSNGITIYFPPTYGGTSGWTERASTYNGTDFGSLGGWSQHISQFLVTKSSDSTSPTLSAVDVTSVADGVSISAYLLSGSEDSAYADFVITAADTGGRWIFASTPTLWDETGYLENVWDGSIAHLTDGTVSGYAVYFFSDSDYHNYIMGYSTIISLRMPLQAMYWDGSWLDCDLFASIDMETDDPPTIDGVYCDNEGVYGELNIDGGATHTLRFVDIFQNDDGSRNIVPYEDPEFHLTYGEGTLSINSDWAPAGDYDVGYMVTDFSDNVGESYGGVTVL